MHDTTPPLVSIDAPSSSGLIVPISWQGQDTLSGLRDYTVRYSHSLTGPWTTWLTGTTATSGQFPGAADQTYYFQVEAVDNVNNTTTAQAGPVTISAVTKYYYHGATRVAMRQGDVVHFLHTDHLGSNSLTTDQAGGVVAQSRYLPYGQTHWLTGTLTTDFQYTSQRQEMGFGLYDYNARYYDSGLGRFISPDTIVPEPGNPQSLNRYSYGYNNPVKFSDPSGHFPWLVVAVVALAVIDYGWTGYDLYQANQVINNPNASSEAKKQAYDTIGLTLGTEIFEPDLGPIQLPLDDIVRHATGIGVLRNIDNASNTVKKAALGLDRHLDSFTRRIGGENYKKWWWWQGGSLITSQDLYDAASWASGDFFEFDFPTAMNNADEIHFNLKGISDIGEAIRKGAIGEGFTNRLVS